MSDLRVRVRYHDIEVEVSAPIKDREYLEANQATHGAIMETIKTATDKIEQLIKAGRRPVEP